jgi:hypothetical protein
MYYTILSVGREDLEPPAPMESFDLTGPLSAGSPALTLGSDASIYACLVYEDQLFGTKERYFVHVFITQIGVALARDILCAFLRPLGPSQRSANAESCHVGVKLFSKEGGHVF